MSQPCLWNLSLHVESCLRPGFPALRGGCSPVILTRSYRAMLRGDQGFLSWTCPWQREGPFPGPRRMFPAPSGALQGWLWTERLGHRPCSPEKAAVQRGPSGLEKLSLLAGSLCGFKTAGTTTLLGVVGLSSRTAVTHHGKSHRADRTRNPCPSKPKRMGLAYEFLRN